MEVFFLLYFGHVFDGLYPVLPNSQESKDNFFGEMPAFVGSLSASLLKLLERSKFVLKGAFV